MSIFGGIFGGGKTPENFFHLQKSQPFDTPYIHSLLGEMRTLSREMKNLESEKRQLKRHVGDLARAGALTDELAQELLERAAELEQRIAEKHEEIRETSLKVGEERRNVIAREVAEDRKRIREKYTFKKLRSPRSLKELIIGRFAYRGLSIEELRVNRKEAKAELEYYQNQKEWYDEEILRVDEKIENLRDATKEVLTFLQIKYGVAFTEVATAEQRRIVEDTLSAIAKDFNLYMKEYSYQLESLQKIQGEIVRNITELKERIDQIDAALKREQKLAKITDFIRKLRIATERIYFLIENLDGISSKIIPAMKKEIRLEYWAEVEKNLNYLYPRDDDGKLLLDLHRLRAQLPYHRKMNRFVRAFYALQRTHLDHDTSFNKHIGYLDEVLSSTMRLRDIWNKNKELVKDENDRFKAGEEGLRQWNLDEIDKELRACKEAREALKRAFRTMKEGLERWEEWHNQFEGIEFVDQDGTLIDKTSISVKFIEKMIESCKKDIQRIDKDPNLDDATKDMEINARVWAITELNRKLAILKEQYSLLRDENLYIKIRDVQDHLKDLETKRASLANRISYLQWKRRQILDSEYIINDLKKHIENEEEIIKEVKKETEDVAGVKVDLNSRTHILDQLIASADDFINRYG